MSFRHKMNCSAERRSFGFGPHEIRRLKIPLCQTGRSPVKKILSCKKWRSGGKEMYSYCRRGKPHCNQIRESYSVERFSAPSKCRPDNCLTCFLVWYFGESRTLLLLLLKFSAGHGHAISQRAALIFSVIPKKGLDRRGSFA